ncbi:MAG: hypothetical protein H6926_09945 [Chromatiales bacterium]|nr:hypothetical protein [Chromatiales bacterium]
MAESLNPDALTPKSGGFLIHDKKGQPIQKKAIDSVWRRFMNKVEAAGIKRFTLHDLKAKGITEQRDNFGGHRDK